MMLSGCSGSKNHGLNPEKPIAVIVWHYYNGVQKDQFDQLVRKFNETEGREQGIVVEAFSKGGVDELTKAAEDSLYKKVGAENLPDLFAAYSDTAYLFDQSDMLVDISAYLTEEESKEYVDAYMEEGRFGGGAGLKLFPIAKSTELLVVNKTDWDLFSRETGVTDRDLLTWEGIVKTAEIYYEWTAGQSDKMDGGKAFFGRDAFANYMLVGSKQLDHEIYQEENGKMKLNLNRDVMKKLWDNYYTPYIKGYFGAYGKFRSDDMKTGDLIAIVGSTGGMTFLPDTVTLEDGTTYSIETKAYPLPGFEGTSPYAVQQGAGMVIVKSDEAREYGAVQFLKWFTREENNMDFAVKSGYFPVKKSSNSRTKLEEVFEKEDNMLSETMKECLLTGMDIVNGYQLFTPKSVMGGKEVREILGSSMNEKARKDREEIQALMSNGMSEKEAVKKFDTQKNFDQWYEQIYEKLSVIGE